MPAWNTAKATGMPSFLESGMSGSHKVFESVTAMASMANATPNTKLSTIAEKAIGPIGLPSQ